MPVRTVAERGPNGCCARVGFRDAVAVRVSADMRKGPRGGGRDRDQIIRHSAFHTMDHAWEMEDKNLRTPTE